MSHIREAMARCNKNNRRLMRLWALEWKKQRRFSPRVNVAFLLSQAKRWRDFSNAWEKAILRHEPKNTRPA